MEASRMSFKELWSKLSLTALAFVAAIFGVLLLPTVAGYSYALLALPAYGAICKGQEIKDLLRGNFEAEDYRAYLLNADCSYTVAVANVIDQLDTEEQKPLSDSKEMELYTRLYKGKSTPQNIEQEKRLDKLNERMHHFRPFSSSQPTGPTGPDESCLAECARGETDPVKIANKYNLCWTSCNTDIESHRGENRFCGNTLIDRLCTLYSNFFSEHFVLATNSGADVMGDALHRGPVVVTFLLLFYAAVIIVVVSILTNIGALIVKGG
jgi:hypothetical protein